MMSCWNVTESLSADPEGTSLAPGQYGDTVHCMQFCDKMVVFSELTPNLEANKNTFKFKGLSHLPCFPLVFFSHDSLSRPIFG